MNSLDVGHVSWGRIDRLSCVHISSVRITVNLRNVLRFVLHAAFVRCWALPYNDPPRRDVEQAGALPSMIAYHGTSVCTSIDAGILRRLGANLAAGQARRWRG